MNLVPLAVVLLGHQGASNRDMRANGWNGRVIGETAAGPLRIGLRHTEMADDLEHQIPLLVSGVAGIDDTRERGIDPEPAVGVAIRFVPHAIRLRELGRLGRIHERPGNRHAIVPDGESRRVVDVMPQPVPTPDFANGARHPGTEHDRAGRRTRR